MIILVIVVGVVILVVLLRAKKRKQQLEINKIQNVKMENEDIEMKVNQEQNTEKEANSRPDHSLYHVTVKQKRCSQVYPLSQKKESKVFVSAFQTVILELCSFICCCTDKSKCSLMKVQTRLKCRMYCCYVIFEVFEYISIFFHNTVIPSKL